MYVVVFFSSSNQQISSHHSSQNVVHSRSSSRDSIDSVIENKNYRKEKISNENDGQILLQPSNSSQNLNERTYNNSSENKNNVDMYATLPRKGRQLTNKNQNCQNTEVYKNYLNRQQRNSSPSVHTSNQPPSRSSTPSSENRDSDSSSQTSDQYRMQLPSHQQVKMNKAEIRQLLHNNMIQRHGNQQSSGGQISQIPRNNTASPSAEVCRTRITLPLSAKSQPIVPPKPEIVVEPSSGGQQTNQGQGIMGNMEYTSSPFAVTCNKFKQASVVRHASFSGSRSSGSHATPVDCYASQPSQTIARSYIQSNLAGTNPSHSLDTNSWFNLQKFIKFISMVWMQSHIYIFF